MAATLVLSAVLASLAPPASAGKSAPPAVADQAVMPATAFDRLARLAGTWRPADEPDSPLRIEFYLTARGSVLVESWQVRGRPHSLTIYHRDGERLLATHYCPQGNQPRLIATGDPANDPRFTFLDATDLDPASESVQHDLWFDLSDPDHPLRGEIYRSNGIPGTPETMRLVRVESMPAEPGARNGP